MISYDGLLLFVHCNTWLKPGKRNYTCSATSTYWRVTWLEQLYFKAGALKYLTVLWLAWNHGYNATWSAVGAYRLWLERVQYHCSLSITFSPEYCCLYVHVTISEINLFECWWQQALLQASIAASKTRYSYSNCIIPLCVHSITKIHLLTSYHEPAFFWRFLHMILTN